MPSLFFLLLFSISSHAQDQSEKKQQLEDVKQQISETSQTIEAKKQEASQLNSLLKKAETDIANVARALSETQNSIATSQKKVRQLKAEQKQLNKNKKHQQTLLAGQIASAYMAGTHDYSKMLLNQQEPSKFERTLSYYQYLNQARLNQIEQLEVTIADLKKVELALAETLHSLKVLSLDQKQQQQNLFTHQISRKQTLQQINLSLGSEQQQLSLLMEQEESISKALEAIRKLASESIELAGLTALRGKLQWPSNGNMVHKYGNRRKGELRWKGVVLGSPNGTPVKTVHQGQVLYADWLKGFGWVIVIDHGDGYMSLYGHNQTLLKSVGEKVETGEPIALVGQSGGQSESGLYFEIRHKGQALDPAKWCRKS